jgi:salicylate hydroxylase
LCLLGDAAHASTPHQGAGAGQAIEDALILSDLLGQITSSANIEQAFRAYDTTRRPRSQLVVTTSREASYIYEMEDKNIGADLNKAKQLLETRCRWIWDENLNLQVMKARDAMATESSL